MKTCLTFDCLG